MSRHVLACVSAGMVIGTLVWAQAPAPPMDLRVVPPAREPSSTHAYFDMLGTTATHWKSYSLRDPVQLDKYKATNSRPPSTTYDPQHDTNPLKQDAAKLVIPEFMDPGQTLPTAINATQTTITFSGAVNIRQTLLIDNEKIFIVSGGTTVPVTRGYDGTTPSAHGAGAKIWRGTNTNPNALHLPVGTEDGHNYLTSWEAWFDERTLRKYTGLVNWKTFQFRRRATLGASPSIWFEVRTRFDGGGSPWKLTLNPDVDVAAVDVRGYGVVGSNVTSQEPLSPMLATFRVVKQTWVRYWMLIDQRANEWDLVSLWAADATHEPVQILDKLQVEVGVGVAEFEMEFNTSTDILKPGRGPLTIYLRNVDIQRDVTSADVFTFLQKPLQ